jgi:hypothetical protein
MKKFLIVLISLLAPCQIILASEYLGEYKCEPTFVLGEDVLFVANSKDDIRLLMINPNREIDFGVFGLIDENVTKKNGGTPEDFLKLKLELFKQYSFRMKISENAGQITQPGENDYVDVYFEHVLVNNGLETDPKILMGYTEFGDKESKDEFWHIREFVFTDVLKDTFKYLYKTYGMLDIDIYTFSQDEDGKTSADPIIRNMLKNLATSGSWIEISPSDTSGTLNFSIDDAGYLLTIRETDKFRAVCKLI